MACVATVLTAQALRAQTPNAVSTKIAIGGNLERLVFKSVIFHADANVAHGGGNRRDLYLSGHPPLLGLMESFRVVEHRTDDFDLIALILSFANLLTHSLDSLKLPSFVFSFLGERSDCILALRKYVHQESLALRIRCHRVVVKPEGRRLEGEIGRVHPLHGVVANEHHAVQDGVVSRDFALEVLNQLEGSS